jgi:hypothetical protein
MARRLFLFFAILALTATASADVTIKATNKLQIPRHQETIEVPAKELAALQSSEDEKPANLDAVIVKDESGKELISQALPGLVIFQSDFAPGETKTFTLSLGKGHKHLSADDYKAYGRFVRERLDDFAWENDRIAHRTYGKAVERGEGLISSSIDIWSKRTNKLVIDKWYMLGTYHLDSGEGFDDYSAGTTRGCGGDGLWGGDKLWPARGFTDSKVIAAGPIRVEFVLDYDVFEFNGKAAMETRIISLDAGSNLDRITVRYTPFGVKGALTAAVGLRKMPDDTKDFNAEHGWLSKNERMEKNGGMQGVALIVDPKQLDKQAEDEKNDLLLLKVSPQNTISYWTGFYWDKSGQFESYDAWKKYVDEASQRFASPIEVSVGK